MANINPGIATVVWEHREYSIVDAGEPDGFAIVHEGTDEPWIFIDEDTDFTKLPPVPLYAQMAARRIACGV